MEEKDKISVHEEEQLLQPDFAQQMTLLTGQMANDRRRASGYKKVRTALQAFRAAKQDEQKSAALALRDAALIYLEERGRKSYADRKEWCEQLVNLVNGQYGEVAREPGYKEQLTGAELDMELNLAHHLVYGKKKFMEAEPKKRRERYNDRRMRVVEVRLIRERAEELKQERALEKAQMNRDLNAQSVEDKNAAMVRYRGVFSELLMLDLNKFNFDSTLDFTKRLVGRRRNSTEHTAKLYDELSRFADFKQAYEKLNGNVTTEEHGFTENEWKELGARFNYLSDVYMEYSLRLDLMSNPYYALLRNSDLKDESVTQLTRRMDQQGIPRSYADYLKTLIERKQRNSRPRLFERGSKNADGQRRARNTAGLPKAYTGKFGDQEKARFNQYIQAAKDSYAAVEAPDEQILIEFDDHQQIGEENLVNAPKGEVKAPQKRKLAHLGQSKTQDSVAPVEAGELDIKTSVKRGRENERQKRIAERDRLKPIREEKEREAARRRDEAELKQTKEKMLKLERDKRVLDTALGAERRMDPETVKEKSLVQMKENAVKALEKLSAIPAARFAILPVKELLGLSHRVREYAGDPQEFQKFIADELSKSETLLDGKELERQLKDADEDEIEENNLDTYNNGELGCLELMRLMAARGVDVSKKGYAAFDGYTSAEKKLLGKHYMLLQGKIYGREKNMEELRRVSISVLSMISGKSETELDRIPLRILLEQAENALPLITDREKARKKVEGALTVAEKQFRSVTEKELNEMAVKAAGNRTAAWELREYCRAYLLEHTAFSDQELADYPAMQLYSMVCAKMQEGKPSGAEDPLVSNKTLEKGYLSEKKAKEDENTKLAKRLADIPAEKEKALTKRKKEFEDYLNANAKKGILKRDGKGTIENKRKQMEEDLKSIENSYELERSGALEKIQKNRKSLKKIDEQLSMVRTEMELDEAERKRSFEERMQRDLKQDVLQYGNRNVQLLKSEKLPEPQKQWSEEGGQTLNFLGDMMSGEEQYDEKGKVLPAEERLRAVLKEHAGILAKLAEARKGENLASGIWNGPLQELGSGVTGEQKKLLATIKEGVLDEILDKLNQSGGQDVAALLDKAEFTAFLKEMSGKLGKVMRAGEEKVQKLLDDATDKLFSPSAGMDALLSEEEEKNDEELSEEEKLAKKLEQDKLTVMRMKDAVYDTSKGQGKFLHLVMKDYFRQADPADRSFMMSYMIKDMKPKNRKLKPGERGGMYFASMLKGAGPVMQKLFQGIPEQMLDKQFHEALSVVKSNLRPIPEKYVLSQLNRIKTDAGLKRIKKLRSLGAASIAETFLCEITDAKRVKKEVVVKILRPDAEQRKEREREFIKKCAIEADRPKEGDVKDTLWNEKEGGVMMASYTAHMRKIDEEFDLKNEAQNIIKGEKSYEATHKKFGSKVSSVKLVEGIPSTKDYLVMDKAEGETVDRYLLELNQQLGDLKEPWKGYNEKTKKDHNQLTEKEAEQFEARKKLETKLREVEKRRKNLVQMARTWANQALFGNYFHHGDLHAGNIMINDEKATVLDYGNCTQLNKDRVEAILRMMAAAFCGFSDDFIDGLRELLHADKGNSYNRMANKEKDVLKARLKVELDKIFELGDGSNTGERIFLAMMKAQEVGFKLPQEIQNFSQCEQRLENSIAEFNSTVEKLRENVAEIDNLPFSGIGEQSFDPVHKLRENCTISANDGRRLCSPAQETRKLMLNFGVVDEETLRYDLEHIEDTGKLEEAYLGELPQALKELTDIATLPQKITEWKKSFPEFRDTIKEDLSQQTNDKKKKKRNTKIIQLRSAIAGIKIFMNDVKGAGLGKYLGGDEKLDALIEGGVSNADQEAFDELMLLLEKQLPKVVSLPAKLKAYREEKNEKKKQAAANDFVETYKAAMGFSPLTMPGFEDIKMFWHGDHFESTYKVKKSGGFYKTAVETADYEEGLMREQYDRVLKEKGKDAELFRLRFEAFVSARREYVKDRMEKGSEDAELRKKRDSAEAEFLKSLHWFGSRELKARLEVYQWEEEYRKPLPGMMEIIAGTMGEHKGRLLKLFKLKSAKYAAKMGVSEDDLKNAATD
ncbi:MAG: hypothetical protein IK115_01810 [Lachnospiraceae bacterium]|nr:hypothetical protein [Lachnospiraceae bacterium]